MYQEEKEMNKAAIIIVSLILAMAVGLSGCVTINLPGAEPEPELAPAPEAEAVPAEPAPEPAPSPETEPYPTPPAPVLPEPYPPPPMPPPETINFIIAEMARQSVTISPKQRAVSQYINVDTEDTIYFVLTTDCWWQNSVSIMGSHTVPSIDDIEIKVSQPTPDKYYVWLSFRPWQRDMYQIEIWNKFSDRSMHVKITYYRNIVPPFTAPG